MTAPLADRRAAEVAIARLRVILGDTLRTVPALEPPRRTASDRARRGGRQGGRR
ncbi:hypothetical protein IL992_36805 [Microbispora sp. NEAU-D428]|uniref:hypothetical protein n=1 Tax=Microbispora sitophila TaxID=2771537 RepID=UPI001869123A|nr:hypothetical protein [Microbispora sitophila]MBE3014698.1 hypothetical protein [Microbispora sitophila]